MMWNCGEMQEVPSWSCHQWLVFSSLSLESFLSSSFPPLTFGSTEHAFLWQSLQWYSFSLDLQDQLCGYNNCFVSSPPILNTNWTWIAATASSSSNYYLEFYFLSSLELKQTFSILSPASMLSGSYSAKSSSQTFYLQANLVDEWSTLKESGNSPITCWLRSTVNSSFLSSCNQVECLFPLGSLDSNVVYCCICPCVWW